MARLDQEQKFLLWIFPNPFTVNNKDQQGVETPTEPFYNPVWHPMFNQREGNLNYAPAQMCPCVKPYFVTNNAQGCKAIRLYVGNGLAGQMCNARVVGMGELPAEYKQTYICCDKWTELFNGLVRIKYCKADDASDPVVTVSVKVKMQPLKGVISLVFHPPVEAFFGTCNTYVKILSIGLKYGGKAFRVELKRAARAQLEDWSFKLKKAADLARLKMYQKGEQEVKYKMRNRQMQWNLMRADREEEWRGEWSDQDDEYNTWVNACCYTSGICQIVGFILPIKFYGMMSTMCMNIITAPMRGKARELYLKKYGLWPAVSPKYGLMNLVGPIMKAAGGLSDLRVKTNLHQVGLSALGIPIYHFMYRDDPCKITYSGAVAQDVLHKKPTAVRVNPQTGFYHIDYSKIDVGFEPIHLGRPECDSDSLDSLLDAVGMVGIALLVIAVIAILRSRFIQRWPL